jgi:aspartate/methionine/tyrosine aminotransferase
MDNVRMRKNITNEKWYLLRYGIREIVDTAQEMQNLDKNMKFTMENIGDPIAKGWPVPPFLKELIVDEVKNYDDRIFGYTHSRGMIAARKWVAAYSRQFCPASKLDFEDVVMTSGLGAAIPKLYEMLKKGTRILQPVPLYPPHASLESFFAGEEPITYALDPAKNWEPDIADIEKKIKDNPSVVGICVINPNNPTGAVYGRETLQKIVDIAAKNKLMIISDEIYFRMVFNGVKYVHLTELCDGRVPLVILRGVSKDVPWPGGRLGWIEFHNTDLDEDFKQYAESVKKRVMMEVCSVTMPQYMLEKIYEHKDFEKWLDDYKGALEENATDVASILEKVPSLEIIRAKGAFYLMPLFKEGVLTDFQTLPIKNTAVRKYVEKEVSAPGFPLDKRFAYYLLGATGICVVPATAFFSQRFGFRVTTLERDAERRKKTYQKLAEAIKEYVG